MIKKEIAEGINIWSGSNNKLAASLTNPTELSRRKGNITDRYPVCFKDTEYIDAEQAYQKK